MWWDKNGLGLIPHEPQNICESFRCRQTVRASFLHQVMNWIRLYEVGSSKFNFSTHEIQNRTSFKYPVLILYMSLNTLSASSGWFIANKNLGLSGKNENDNVFMAFTDVMQIMNSRQGAKLMKNRFRLKFIGMINIPKIAEYMNIIGINIDTKEAARGAVSLVWNSLTYEKILA